MRLLLDTHAFLWWDEDELPKKVVLRIQRAEEVFVSAASAWEISIKAALGKVSVKGSVAEALEDYGFSPLPITLEHAEGVRALPRVHRDPFDRILVAQALAEDLVLVSADEVLRKYGAAVVWE